MYYAYILKCDNGKKYYGHTNNLSKRIKDHRNGRVYATRNKRPQVVYYEEFVSCQEAFKREMQFKNGRMRKSTIEQLINNFAKSKCQGFNSQTRVTKKRGRYDLRRPSEP
ncbi:MAG: GIY-YIG nuclease family protein [Candidatus Omnitrophica bacterium]|nr:GIY-YIG nuclease family protein [Candidatus Omnitrophota bacterium]